MTATATAPDTQQAADPVINVPCKFSAQSNAGDSGTIGVKIDRSHLGPMAAAECFCGNQLTGRICVQPLGDDPQQQYFDDSDIQHEVAGVFTVGGYRVDSKNISISLKYTVASVDIEQLSHFPKKTGRLLVELVQKADG